MDNTLAALIKISNATGKDPALTQASGGNTSVKTDDGKYMFIKASGTALKNISAKRGWRRLRLDAVLGIIKDKRLAKLPTGDREPEVVKRLLLTCDDDVTGNAMPSVESPLHALLDKCVIHLHPLVIGAYANAKNGRRQIEKLFKNDNHPPLWIPYAPPGFMLAKKVSRFVAAYQNRYGRKPAIIMLAKHGLFVTAKTAHAAIRLTHRVINRCKSRLPKPRVLRIVPPAEWQVREAKLAIRKAVFAATKRYLPVSHFFNKDIAGFMSRADAAKLLSKGALGPAELVYANGGPMWVETPCAEKIAARLKKLIDKGRKPPSTFVIKGLGLFVAADKKTAPLIAEVAIGSLIVRNWASQFGGVCALTPGERNFIIKWGIEAPQHNTQ
jgi:rhamnose utilization protein RhaD (predicted bifunctional aldolase and dehydrogenase)